MTAGTAFERYRDCPSNSYGDVYGPKNPWVQWLKKHHPDLLRVPIGRWRGLAKPKESK